MSLGCANGMEAKEEGEDSSNMSLKPIPENMTYMKHLLPPQ